MTAAPSKAVEAQASRRRKEASPAGKARVRKVLVVVDGSERTGKVLEQARALASSDKPIEVVLLNVQPAPVDGRLRGYGSFKREAIEARLDGLGKRAVTAAGRVLSHYSIRHTSRIELGDVVETIFRVAGEEGCDLIVVADAPPGRLQKAVQKATGVLIATPAGQVAQLAEIPVIVVK